MSLLASSCCVEGGQTAPGAVASLPSASTCWSKESAKFRKEAFLSTQNECLCISQLRAEMQAQRRCEQEENKNYIKRACPEKCGQRNKRPFVGLFNAGSQIPSSHVLFLMTMMLTKHCKIIPDKAWWIITILACVQGGLTKPTSFNNRAVQRWIDSTDYDTEALRKTPDMRNVVNTIATVLKSMVADLNPHLKGVDQDLDDRSKENQKLSEKHDTLLSNVRRFISQQNQSILQLANRTRIHQESIQDHGEQLRNKTREVEKLTKSVQQELQRVGLPGDVLVYILAVLGLVVLTILTAFMGEMTTIQTRRLFLEINVHKYVTLNARSHYRNRPMHVIKYLNSLSVMV